MQNLIVIVLIALSQFTVNGAFKIQPRIVRGDAAQRGQFPYFAYLQLELYNGVKTDTRECGAVLISDEFLLTSAECLTFANRAVVHLGATEMDVLQSESKIVIVGKENFHVHPGYHYAITMNDIGLIRLPVKVSFTDKVQPVRMPTKCEFIENVEAVVMGHGGTEENDDYSSHLNFAVLKTISMDECHRALPFNVYRNTAFCAKDEQRNQMVWHGDKGAPLVRSSDGVLIGITSFWRHVNKRQNGTQGFTNVSAFLEWINQMTGLNLPTC